MDNNNKKNSFTFLAKFFNQAEQEIVVEIASPYNTDSFTGIKGIELYSDFSDFRDRIKNYQLTLISEIAKQDSDYNLYLTIPKKDIEEKGYNAYFTDLEWYKVRSFELQNSEIPNKIAIEIYKYIVETIFSTFEFELNKIGENGEKGWYSIENYKEIVFEYMKVYSYKYEDFLTLSPSQITNILEGLVREMMRNKIHSETETLSTELKQ
jgi:hypothetical protein